MNSNINKYIDKKNWPNDLYDAKQFANQALSEFKFRKKIDKFAADVDAATTVHRVQFIIINAILSGDGFGVVKL